MKTLTKIVYALSAVVIFTACGSDSKSNPKAKAAAAGEETNANSYSSFDLAKRINEATKKTNESLTSEGRSREETQALVLGVALTEYNTALKEKPGTSKNALEAILMLDDSTAANYLWKTYTFGSSEKAAPPYNKQTLQNSKAELISLINDEDRNPSEVEFKGLKDGKIRIRLEVAQRTLKDIDEKIYKTDERGRDLRDELRTLRVDTTTLRPIPDAPAKEEELEVAPVLSLNNIDPRPENTEGTTIGEVAVVKAGEQNIQIDTEAYFSFVKLEVASAQLVADQKFVDAQKEKAALKKEADAKIAASKATRIARQNEVVASYKAYLKGYEAAQANRKMAAERVEYLERALIRGERFISDINDKLDEVYRDEEKAREKAQIQQVVDKAKGMQQK